MEVRSYKIQNQQRLIMNLHINNMWLILLRHLLIAQWKEKLIRYPFIKSTTQVKTIYNKILNIIIGPGMYNWDVGFDSTKKKNESLMYTIL